MGPCSFILSCSSFTRSTVLRVNGEALKVQSPHFLQESAFGFSVLPRVQELKQRIEIGVQGRLSGFLEQIRIHILDTPLFQVYLSVSPMFARCVVYRVLLAYPVVGTFFTTAPARFRGSDSSPEGLLEEMKLSRQQKPSMYRSCSVQK